MDPRRFEMKWAKSTPIVEIHPPISVIHSVSHPKSDESHKKEKTD